MKNNSFKTNFAFFSIELKRRISQYCVNKYVYIFSTR